MGDSLATVLAEAKDYESGAQSAPPNEAATCDWIIKPILIALGYANRELLPQNQGSAGNIPDYTVLPGTEATWYLEAKAWKESLTEVHAIQATTYAYQNGRRWAVLTNGRRWQLFDCHITEKPQDRLVAEAHLDQAEALMLLLEAISRESVLSGKIEAFARKAALEAAIREKLMAGGPLLDALVRSVRQLPGLSKTTPDEVLAALGQPAPIRPVRSASLPRASVSALPSAGVQIATLLQLADCQPAPTGKKPKSVTLPDGSSVVATTWKVAVHAIIEWLGKQPNASSLLDPVATGYFLNRERMGKKKPMRVPEVVSIAGQSVWMETHASAEALVTRAAKACEAMDVDAAGITVTFGK